MLVVIRSHWFVASLQQELQISSFPMASLTKSFPLKEILDIKMRVKCLMVPKVLEHSVPSTVNGIWAYKCLMWFWTSRLTNIETAGARRELPGVRIGGASREPRAPAASKKEEKLLHVDMKCFAFIAAKPQQLHIFNGTFKSSISCLHMFQKSSIN